MALSDRNEPFNSGNLSPAASSFIRATRAATAEKFSNLFKINPYFALELMQPAKLFGREILREMERQAERNPHAYLDCLEAVSYGWDESGDTFLERWLQSNTQKTIEGLVKTDPLSVLVTPDRDYPNKMHLIKNDAARAYAIQDNLDMVEFAYEGVMLAIGRTHINSLNGLIDDATALPNGAENLLSRLTELKKTLLKEQIKQCFAAARGESCDLTNAVQIILSEPAAASETGYFASVREKGSATNVMLLSNPSVNSPDDEEQPHELWVIERSGKILAQTFIEANLWGYMEVQKAVSDMPDTQVLDILAASRSASPN